MEPLAMGSAGKGVNSVDQAIVQIFDQFAENVVGPWFFLWPKNYRF